MRTTSSGLDRAICEMRVPATDTENLCDPPAAAETRRVAFEARAVDAVRATATSGGSLSRPLHPLHPLAPLALLALLASLALLGRVLPAENWATAGETIWRELPVWRRCRRTGVECLHALRRLLLHALFSFESHSIRSRVEPVEPVDLLATDSLHSHEILSCAPQKN